MGLILIFICYFWIKQKKMKKYYLIILVFSICTTYAQVEWTGAKTTFTKAPNADWNLESNQDRITSNVWITRKNSQGIFNIAQETAYQQGANVSPVDTEWAFGSISDDVGTLTFTSWDTAHGGNGGGGPSGLIGQDMVLHLITDDIYIDIKFLSWGMGGGGGGSFSYERSTETLSAEQFGLSSQISVYPNPSTKYIQVSGINNSEDFIIYNILGKEVKKGIISKNETIEISDFPKGVYLIKLNDQTIKFLKK